MLEDLFYYWARKFNNQADLTDEEIAESLYDEVFDEYLSWLVSEARKTLDTIKEI